MTHYVKEEICLNSDRSAVVSCDSPAAHFKLTPPFGHLEDDEAKALGLLTEGKPGAEKPDGKEDTQNAPTIEPEKKAVAAAPQNKARSTAAKK